MSTEWMDEPVGLCGHLYVGGGRSSMTGPPENMTEIPDPP